MGALVPPSLPTLKSKTIRLPRESEPLCYRSAIASQQDAVPHPGETDSQKQIFAFNFTSASCSLRSGLSLARPCQKHAHRLRGGVDEIFGLHIARARKFKHRGR